MIQEKERLTKRVQFLLAHTRELIDCLASQACTRRRLKEQHIQERVEFYESEKGNPINWAGLIIRQSEQLMELAQANGLERQSLLALQEQALMAFDQALGS